MKRKRNSSEAITHLLVVITGTLSIPAISPIMMIVNTRGYTNEDSLMPNIWSAEELISALTAVVYAFALLGTIGRIVFFASVDGTVLDSRSSEVKEGRSVAGSTPEPMPILIEDLTFPSAEIENGSQQRGSES
jgi:hypothetical protein